MAKCRTCGTEYHACSNCGFRQLEYEYCVSCVEDKLKELKEKSELFAKGLSLEQCDLYLEVYLHNDEYGYFDTAIENRQQELKSTLAQTSP